MKGPRGGQGCVIRRNPQHVIVVDVRNMRTVRCCSSTRSVRFRRSLPCALLRSMGSLNKLVRLGLGLGGWAEIWPGADEPGEGDVDSDDLAYGFWLPRGGSNAVAFGSCRLSKGSRRGIGKATASRYRSVVASVQMKPLCGRRSGHQVVLQTGFQTGLQTRSQTGQPTELSRAKTRPLRQRWPGPESRTWAYR